MHNVNETLTTIRNRRSVREYSDDCIPESMINDIIEAATFAPSPFNNQPWQFVVVTDTSKIKIIAEFTAEKIDAIAPVVREEARHDYLQYRKNALFFENAGVLILVLMKPLIKNAKQHYWGVVDFFDYEASVRSDIMCIGAACQNLMLAAESVGLSTCLMHYPLIANVKIREMLDIHSPWEIAAFIPLGIRKSNPALPKRRVPEKIVRFIS